jgi:hypothetical protein
MARNVPHGRIASLQWLEGIYPVWSANAASIGLTSAQTLDLAQDVVNTRGAFTSVTDIRAESKAKTQTFYSQSDALSTKAGALLTIIKGFAKASTDPEAVYQLAQITGKAPPSPVPAPQQPTIFSARLGGDGSVTIDYIGNGAIGTVWQVSRKCAAESTFSFIGNADARTKSFTDTTLPAGTAGADYQVQGVRGSETGQASFPLTVRFGTAAPAAAPASQTQAA